MASTKTSVTFLDGCVVEKDTYLFSCRLDSQPIDEYDLGIIEWYVQGKWIYQKRDWQVSSVCVMRPTPAEARRASIALEEGSGIVGLYWPGAKATDDEVLPGAEDGHGIASLTDVKQIGTALYVCGYGGKVFRRSSGKWAILDQGLKALDLGDYMKQGLPIKQALAAARNTQRNMKAIDGLSEQEIYCVGRAGLIFRFDGATWIEVESPTNANLHCVHCAADGWTYAAGEPGVLLRGNDKGFQALQTGVNDDFYALTSFNGMVYVGGLKGLYRLEADGLHAVDTKQGSFSCVALDSADGQLLVVAERWLLVFDGVDWKRIDDPDNV
ncbi:hypothetical protein F2P45_15425 [Massilia sp. CCM 8733]|uniref:Uncharacterized protein n=1 Tax=Massilia mucilaginosa TaxID=2609282 RepID=A0ABX0NU37_9BURK|nr:hypothetical protein [Massilia mucilaginosa]NHZ90398.1 hypothetical protein [Massilia mucilaginosa]